MRTASRQEQIDRFSWLSSFCATLYLPNCIVLPLGRYVKEMAVYK